MAGEAIQVDPGVSSVNEYSASLFRHLPTDMRMKKTLYNHFYPQNALKNATTIQFILPSWSSAAEYCVSDIIAVVHYKLTGLNGIGHPDDNKRLGPINNELNSLFSSLKIYLNDRLITSSPEHNPIKSYIETTLNYNNDCKQTFLSLQGYYQEVAGMVDSTSSDNHGWVKRWEPHIQKTEGTPEGYTYPGNVVEVLGKLCTDFSESEVRLPRGVACRIELGVSKAAFFLHGQKGAEGGFEIVNMELLLPVGQQTEGLALENEKLLKTKPYVLNFRRRSLTSYSIPSTSSVYTSDNLFVANVIPLRAVCAIVKTKSLNGNFETSPYNFCSGFDNWGKVNSIEITINGESGDALTPACRKFDYFKMYKYSGFMDAMDSMGITPELFDGGVYLALFDFTTTLQAAVQSIGKIILGSVKLNKCLLFFFIAVPSVRVGNLRLILNMSKSPYSTNPLHCQDYSLLVLAEYSAQILINEHREVSCNYLT